ncbi:uncharacterized protein [Diadema antillarum]|uniref:uncharacterized protein n=1 Tax=Diadema antillarum TaxID=105358 RepID=UPI003A8467E6
METTQTPTGMDDPPPPPYSVAVEQVSVDPMPPAEYPESSPLTTAVTAQPMPTAPMETNGTGVESEEEKQRRRGYYDNAPVYTQPVAHPSTTVRSDDCCASCYCTGNECDGDCLSCLLCCWIWRGNSHHHGGHVNHDHGGCCDGDGDGGCDCDCKCCSDGCDHDCDCDCGGCDCDGCDCDLGDCDLGGCDF